MFLCFLIGVVKWCEKKVHFTSHRPSMVPLELTAICGEDYALVALLPSLESTL